MRLTVIGYRRMLILTFECGLDVGDECVIYIRRRAADARKHNESGSERVTCHSRDMKKTYGYVRGCW